MVADLISIDEYENLPDEPEAQFVALEGICRKNFYKAVSGASGADSRLLHLNYMSTIAAIAETLDINFPFKSNEVNINNFEYFQIVTSSLVAKFNLKNAGIRNPNSVRLQSRTRNLIEIEVQNLRKIISESNLPEDRIKVLLKKLDELVLEINRNRMNFGKVFAILAFVGAGLTQTTTFVIEAPEAIAKITAYVGEDKEAENQEILRLRPPQKPKQLPAPDE